MIALPAPVREALARVRATRRAVAVLDVADKHAAQLVADHCTASSYSLTIADPRTALGMVLHGTADVIVVAHPSALAPYLEVAGRVPAPGGTGKLRRPRQRVKPSEARARRPLPLRGPFGGIA